MFGTGSGTCLVRFDLAISRVWGHGTVIEGSVAVRVVGLEDFVQRFVDAEIPAAAGTEKGYNRPL